LREQRALETHELVDTSLRSNGRTHELVGTSLRSAILGWLLGIGHVPSALVGCLLGIGHAHMARVPQVSEQTDLWGHGQGLNRRTRSQPSDKVSIVSIETVGSPNKAH
jgi:hypothetical protein